MSAEVGRFEVTLFLIEHDITLTYVLRSVGFIEEMSCGFLAAVELHCSRPVQGKKVLN